MDTKIDLRWLLLNKLVDFDNLQNLYKLSVIVLFLIFLLLTLSPIIISRFRKSKFKSLLLSDNTFIFSLIAFISATRWPCFLPPELNPDESFLIAGAMKLLKDPVVWRSIETGTTGPLNLYSLLISSLLGLRLEYASARMVGLFLIVVSSICLFYSLRYIYGNLTARLSVMPVVTTIACMTFPDYVHYTSEHVSIAILSIALLILCKLYSNNLIFNKRLIFIFGFILGLVPFAKLQAVPIALSISLITLHILWIRRNSITQFLRNFYAFLLGSVLFPLLTMLYIFVFSLQDVFWRSYIQHNLYYANSYKASVGFLSRLYFVFGPADTRVLFALAVIFFLLGLSFLIYWFISQPQRDRLSDTSIFFLYSLIILAASIYSVMKPGNFFTHYLLFLIFPCGFLIGVLVGEFFKVYKYSGINLPKLKLSPVMAIIIVIMIIGSTLQLFSHVRRESSYIDMRYHFLLNYTSPVSQTILKYASQNGSMAIWGWDSKIYVETGIIPATRYVDSVGQMFSNPRQQYYVRQFADDLLKSKAALFIESTAGFAKIWEKYVGIPQQSPEDFPDVAIILKKYYKLVDDVQGFKIYVKQN
jgi:hypothetical protein